MINIERLKRIDDFFGKLSIEEFEEKLEIAGIGEIESSSRVNMELLLSSKYIIDQNRSLLYTEKKDQISKGENSYDFFSKDYTKAV